MTTGRSGWHSESFYYGCTWIEQAESDYFDEAGIVPE
jgi:hypothetical protein